MKAASEARVHRNLDAANGLLTATLDIAEMFWKSKGATPVRQPSRQTTGGELVYPS